MDRPSPAARLHCQALPAILTMAAPRRLFGLCDPLRPSRENAHGTSPSRCGKGCNACRPVADRIAFFSKFRPAAAKACKIGRRKWIVLIEYCRLDPVSSPHEPLLRPIGVDPLACRGVEDTVRTCSRFDLDHTASQAAADRSPRGAGSRFVVLLRGGAVGGRFFCNGVAPWQTEKRFGGYASST